jgi:hypothetical protein
MKKRDVFLKFFAGFMPVPSFAGSQQMIFLMLCHNVRMIKI